VASSTCQLGFSVSVLAACSGQTGAPPPAGDSVDAAPPAADSFDASASASLQASIGPIDVPPGAETTKCIVRPLGNTEDVVLDGYDIDLAAGSHHVILYLTTDAPQAKPVDCVPFTGLGVGTDVPLAFANKAQVSWSFPAGIGIDLPANANLRIEGHYINATSRALQGHGTISFRATPKATHAAYQPAGFLFYGTTNISIPPHASWSTGKLFQAAPRGMHLVSITTHEHHLGTRVQAWTSASPGDVSNPIVDDQDWTQPSWKTLDPTVDFTGKNGLSFQCDWTNTTAETVTFGESALDEMCFVGGYVYPYSGVNFCLDGSCTRGN
jgi:hypothetical protein